MLWIILAVVVALVLALVLRRPRPVRRGSRVENAWAQVDVQLRKRYDLIPNLAETVKGYAAHERETFEAVTAARTRPPPPPGAPAPRPPRVAEQAQAENMLTQAIGRLFAVAEAYPQLRATENFQQLQAQLSDVGQNIAGARPGYNDPGLSY